MCKVTWLAAAFGLHLLNSHSLFYTYSDTEKIHAKVKSVKCCCYNVKV